MAHNLLHPSLPPLARAPHRDPLGLPADRCSPAHRPRTARPSARLPAAHPPMRPPMVGPTHFRPLLQPAGRCCHVSTPGVLGDHAFSESGSQSEQMGISALGVLSTRISMSNLGFWGKSRFAGRPHFRRNLVARPFSPGRVGTHFPRENAYPHDSRPGGNRVGTPFRRK